MHQAQAACPDHNSRGSVLQVVEVNQRNTGRDPFPLLLHRCQLPKTPNVPTVGEAVRSIIALHVAAHELTTVTRMLHPACRHSMPVM